MSHDEVMGWVARYEQAWRDRDLAAVEQLFSTGAHYRPSPYEESEIGHAGIKAFWLDDEDEVFTMEASAVAVDGPRCGISIGCITRRAPRAGVIRRIGGRCLARVGRRRRLLHQGERNTLSRLMSAIHGTGPCSGLRLTF